MSQPKVVKLIRSKNTKGVLSPNVLGRCNDLFNLLQIAGGAMPVMGGPVKAVGQLACSLIQVVQVKHPYFEHVMDVHND
jgi:hypothetical protein